MLPRSWASVQPAQPVPRIMRVGLEFGGVMVVRVWALLRVVRVILGGGDVWRGWRECLLIVTREIKGIGLLDEIVENRVDGVVEAVSLVGEATEFRKANLKLLAVPTFDITYRKNVQENGGKKDQKSELKK